MQRFADGHIAVIRDGSQEKKKCYCKEVSKKHLTGTGIVDNDIVTNCDVLQVSGNIGSCEWDLQEVEILLKKLHWHSQVAIHKYKCDDGQIPSDIQHVCEK